MTTPLSTLPLTHSLTALSQYTLSTHPPNIPSKHTLSIHPLNTPTQPTRLTNPPNTLSPPPPSPALFVTGLSDDNPPSVHIVSDSINISPTPIDNYPRILGVAQVSLRIAVIDRIHNQLSSLRLVANFSQYLHGRSVITLTLPFLTSQVGYFQAGYGLDGTMTWNGYNHTLTVVKSGGWAGWQATNGSVVIALTGRQVSTFFVNDRGIPERGYRYLTNLSNPNPNTYGNQGVSLVGGVATSRYDFSSGVEATAMLAATSFAPNNLATNGSGTISLTLLPIPIENINPLPVVQGSSIRFNPPLFSDITTGGSEITIQVSLNTPAYPGDVFMFKLYGSQLYLHNNATTPISVRMTGGCVTTLTAGKNYSVVHSNATYNPLNSTLTFMLSSHTTEGGNDGSVANASCIIGRTYFLWTIPASVGITAPHAVMQYQSNLQLLQWQNRFSNTGWLSVSDASEVIVVSCPCRSYTPSHPSFCHSPSNILSPLFPPLFFPLFSSL